MKESEESPSLASWLTTTDPRLGWPVFAWIAFAMCVGIVLGVVLS